MTKYYDFKDESQMYTVRNIFSGLVLHMCVCYMTQAVGPIRRWIVGEYK